MIIKTRAKCYLIETTEEFVSSDMMIYKEVANLWGNPIYGAKIVFSTNETYIKNTLLINQGRAATNSQRQVKLYHLYIVVDEPLVDGDYTIDGNVIYGPYEEGDYAIEGFKGKILYSTDKKLTNVKDIHEIQVSGILESLVYDNPVDMVIIKDDENTTQEVAKKTWSEDEVRSLFRNFRTDVLPLGQVVDAELNDWLNKNLL